MCEVTSANFFELLPLILDQIDQSSFLAIDTEFSSIDTFSFSTKTIQQFYQQRAKFTTQITIFQFGLAIFSQTSDQHKYHVNIYNFYLNPTSINPIDVKYIMQSSSIKFLAEYKFDFNKCFYSGISFLNQSQEDLIIQHHKSISTHQLSISEKNFLTILFEKINKWLITARLGEQMQYDLAEKQYILNDYQLQTEICRCFKTIWTTIQRSEDRKILLIEHITKETYEQRLQEKNNDDQELRLFLQSLTGFTILIRHLQKNYRKPIVGHNCFLDWLLIYEKFVDTLPMKFDEFQRLTNANFSFTIFDTKYLALEMKGHLFTRQNRSEISNYVENLTTATSLASLYDLLTSKYYESLIFFKPTIEIIATDRYKYEVRQHEAGYDAYMSGVLFLKLVYLYKQKKCHRIDSNEYQSIFDICLNEIQVFKNRFYSTFLPYVSLNRVDQPRNSPKKFQPCLVLQKHHGEKLDMSDIVTRFNAYCSMDYEMNRNVDRVYLFVQSEHVQRQILKDYFNHAAYKIERFNWLKHSLIVRSSLGIAIVMTGICIVLLVKRRLFFN